jgi:hypothetical protein
MKDLPDHLDSRGGVANVKPNDELPVSVMIHQRAERNSPTAGIGLQR